MCGTASFPEKTYSLSSGFFKLSAEECTVGATKPILLLPFKVVQFLKFTNVQFLVVFISMLLLFFSISYFHSYFEILLKLLYSTTINRAHQKNMVIISFINK